MCIKTTIHANIHTNILANIHTGTGSETTGTIVFGDASTHAKTGISSRVIRPTLAIVDPMHTVSMPRNVAACVFVSCYVIVLEPALVVLSLASDFLHLLYPSGDFY